MLVAQLFVKADNVSGILNNHAVSVESICYTYTLNNLARLA